MADYKISYRYASSLLDMSVEKKFLDVVSKDMKLISSLLEENPELNRMMKSPVVKPNVKAIVIDEVFKNRIDKESLSFIHFILNKGRENFLLNIVKKFLELKDDYMGILNVDVKVAFDFSDDQKELLKEKLEKFFNKKINLKFKIEKDIIGGFVAKAGDTVYDASVKHQLELLKKQFLSGTLSLN